jgi:hypothetical protein
MIRFCDDGMNYLTWTAAHPDGYVLNVRRMADPDYAAAFQTTSKGPARSQLETIKKFVQRADRTSTRR